MKHVTISRDDRAEANNDCHPVKDRIETDFQQVEGTEDQSRHQGCHPNWAAFAQVLEEVAPEADFFAHTKREAQEQAIDEEGQRTCHLLESNNMYPASGILEPKHQRDDQNAEYHTDRDIKQTLVKRWKGNALPGSSVDRATVHVGQAKDATDVEERKDEPTDDRRDTHIL